MRGGPVQRRAAVGDAPVAKLQADSRPFVCRPDGSRLCENSTRSLGDSTNGLGRHCSTKHRLNDFIRLLRRPVESAVLSGHPLADRRQASKRLHGGASRRLFLSPYCVCSELIAPVSSTNGYDESRQTPIRIKRAAMTCRSPWRPGRPRRTLVPQRVQWVEHIPVAADALAPIRGWLALRAIRVYCKSVTATRHPIHSRWLWLQSAFLACRSPSLVMRSSASRRMACAPSECGSMLERVCVPAP